MKHQPDRMESDAVKVICKCCPAAVHAREEVDRTLGAFAALLEVAEATVSECHQVVA